MFTEEFKKACEGCQSEEELKAVIDAHKSELTDEELQQVSGGYIILGFHDDPENPFGFKNKFALLQHNIAAPTACPKVAD